MRDARPALNTRTVTALTVSAEVRLMIETNDSIARLKLELDASTKIDPGGKGD